MLPGIGVFGTGPVLRVLVPFLRAKGFKVEAIWGQTLDAAEEMGKELEIPFRTHHVDDVLLHKEIDLVLIMCPPSLHAQIAVKALGIGKHVLCDKPGGLNQSEALKMVHAAQYYPSLISIMAYTLRFLPSVQQMRREILSRAIGDIQLCEVHVHLGSLVGEKYDWMCEEGMGGGVLSLMGSHIIDVISHITNQKAVRVHGVMRTLTQTTEKISGIRRITSEDFCTFQMELNGGVLASVTLNSHFNGDYSHEIIVCGTEGYLTIRNGELFGSSRATSCPELRHNDTDELSFLPSHIVSHPLPVTWPRPFINGLFRLVTTLKEAFASVEDRTGWIKEPVSLASTFEDGQYVQAVLEAIRKSAKERMWCRVTPLTEEPDPNPALSAAVRRTNLAL